jgi:TP901 family phage tail tape measure protein
MAVSLNASLNVKLNPTSLASSSKQIQHALGRITGQASEFQKSLDASTARVFAFGATTAVINSVTQSFKKLVSTTIEVQKKLIEINSIFQATDANFNKFRNSIFKVAKETGQSFNTVADGAAELARQGLSAAETANRLKAALVLTRISGLDSAKSVKALTAAINGFASAGLNANQIVNKMVAVDTAFAVSTQDLAEAFSRAGSTAEDAGVSFNELLGLVTAVEQRTARGGAVIGNAFKSIFTRISRGSTIEKLKELGVEIDATQTGIQKLNALSQALQNVSDPTIASQIKELAGGVFQINVVSAALKDLSSDTSIFAKAAATASSATNEAFEKNAELSKSISSQINVLIQGLTSLSERIGTITFGPLLQNLLGLTTKFTEFLDKALDPEKGNVFIKGLFKAIGSFLSGPAVVIFTAAFVKIFKLIAKFAGDGLRSLFSVGSQTERIRSIEGGIVGLLQRDDVLRKTILSSTVSQAQKEQAVISAIQRENRELEQQAALMRKIASAAAARGVTGFNPNNGSFKGRRGKRYATGFMEEEATARTLGASSNVQAHFGKGTIGGSRFVMNDNEVEIPNFAGGNSAVIPMYAGGNMPSYPMGRLPLNQRTDITTREQAIAKNYSPAQASSRFGPAKKVKKAKQMEDIIQVNPSESAMLVPNIGLTSRIPKGTAGRFKFKGKTMGFEYGSGLGVYGPKVPETVDGAADPQDERLRQNITRGVTTSAANYAGSLNPILGKPKPAAIRKMLERQGGGKGALRGVVGAAFEAAVNVGLGISPARKVDGGDFDIKGASGEKRKDVNKMFGVKNKATNLYDYKENLGRGSYSSYAKKLANQGKYKTVKREKRTGKSFAGGYIPKSTRRFAGGYMPKFAKGAGGGEAGAGKMSALMGGLFALQTIVGGVNSKYQENSKAITDGTEARIKSIKESGREYSEITKLISGIEEEGKKREATIPPMVQFVNGVEKATAALMAFSAISMVTGGGLGKAGKFLFSGRKAGTTAMKTASKASPKIKRVNHSSRYDTKPDLKKAYLKEFHAKEAATKAARSKSIKRTGQKAMQRTVLAKAAGPIALIMGAVEMNKTRTDDSLEQSQKNERYKSTAGSVAGGALAGAATGAVLGSFIPVIGTAIGAIVGGVFGSMGGGALFGDVEGADRKVAERKEDSRGQAKDLGRLDFDTEESFQKKVTENLNKVKSEQGYEAAQSLEDNHGIIEAEMAQFIDEQKKRKADPEFENSAETEEKFAHERKKIQDRLNKATMRLAGVRFLTVERERENRVNLDNANFELLNATNKLKKARAAIAKNTLKTTQAVEGGQDQGKIRNSLATSISGPFAGAVGLASEQNTMFADMNAARFEKSQADEALALAKTDGSGAETIAGLQDAAKAAGDAFKKSVTGAAVSFKNKMASLAQKQLDITKQKNQLTTADNEAARSLIGKVSSGEISGSTKPLGEALTNVEAYDKNLEKQRKKDPNFKMSQDQVIEYDRLITAVKSGAESIGLNSDIKSIFEAFLPEIGKRLQGEGPTGLKAQARASIVGEKEFEKEHGKGIRSLMDKDLYNKDAISDLNKAQIDLKEQIKLTEENYKILNETSDTKALAENVTDLADKMTEAATSMGKLNEFSATITKSVADTTGMITDNARFVKTQEAIVVKLVDRLQELETLVKELSTDDLKTTGS